MRHGPAQRRSRGRGQPQQGQGRRGGNSGPNRNQVFDSNGPDVRIRGTAHQILEKYTTLAKDAAATGDHVMAEAYLQHAEHYQRVINSWGDDSVTRVDTSSEEFTNDRFTRRTPGVPAAPESDLGLPASILGAGPVSEAAKNEELADA